MPFATVCKHIFLSVENSLCFDVLYGDRLGSLIHYTYVSIIVKGSLGLVSFLCMDEALCIYMRSEMVTDCLWWTTGRVFGS